MHVITVAQRKGGTGKTTLAVHLCGELARRGYRLGLIDADPQGSATEWAAPKALRFPVRRAPDPASWFKTVRNAPGTLLVVDTPAGLGDAFEEACVASDLIVLPCSPSSLDLVSLQQTVAAIRADPRQRSRRTPILLVPTRLDPKTEEGRQFTAELRALGLPLAPAMSYDMAYVRAFATGEAVATFAPDSSADREMRAIAAAVVQQLEGGLKRLAPLAARMG